MTSYEERLNRERKRDSVFRKVELEERITTIMNLVNTFMHESPELKKLKMRDTQMALTHRRVGQFLQKEYRRVSNRPYRNIEASDRFPEFNVHITNNPEVFAAYLNTTKSREMKCLSMSVVGTRFAYNQHKWDVLINPNLKFRNPDADYFTPVDFQTEEAYLLFGRISYWEETQRRKDVCVKKDGKTIKESQKTTTAWSSESKAFMLLLYVPAEKDEKLENRVMTIEKEVERLIAQKEKKAKRGFFARLLGA